MDEILDLSIVVNLPKKAIYFFGEIGLFRERQTWFNLSWNHFFNKTSPKIPHNTRISINHESFLTKFLKAKNQVD